MIRTPNVTVHAGHVLEQLALMADDSVDMCVTSPPYWGLRAYGTEAQVWGGDPECAHEWDGVYSEVAVGSQNPNGKSTLATTGTKHNATIIPTLTATCATCGAWRGELGLEPTPEMFVEHLVLIFREVRRVMRPHGTLWLNIGDSYSSGGRSTYDTQGGISRIRGSRPKVPRMRHTGRNDSSRETPGGRGGSFRGGSRADVPVLMGPEVKPKDMVGIPWLTAFALRADGWYLRAEVIWSKPNPMPESVVDRPTKSHEQVFLLSKREGYYYDRVAIREPLVSSDSDLRKMADQRRALNGEGGGRNARSVWTIATQPYEGAHFATFPEELPRRCIAASCPMQVCITCGRPSERIVHDPLPEDPPDHTGIRGRGDGVASVQSRMTGTDYMEWREEHPPVTVGWTDCGHGTYTRGVVLDPFAGSGTSLAVAVVLGRRAVGIELNTEYLRMVERRVAEAELVASRASLEGGPIVAVPVADMGPLWEGIE